MRTVLIAGAAGFIGSHVAEEAERAGLMPRLMMHHRRPPLPGRAYSTVAADLTEPETLAAACDGVDVLLHCAPYVGSDPAESARVNERGTRHLVTAARRAGVERIIYVSTASVYGRGTFRGVTPTQLGRNPGSCASEGRARAEDAVLEFGGTVLRPHLVHGREGTDGSRPAWYGYCGRCPAPWRTGPP